MVVRPDELGRRWKVPHNFYRVKDRDDGYALDGDAVMRVVRLADRDKSVYRYLHHIFSEKFSPIDAQNVWSGILDDVRKDPTWQRLASRTAAEERRASDRTRAGHAARKEKSGVRTHLKAVTDSAVVRFLDRRVTAPNLCCTHQQRFASGCCRQQQRFRDDRGNRRCSRQRRGADLC